MKRILIRVTVAIISFSLGIASSRILDFRPLSVATPSIDGVPYDEVINFKNVQDCNSRIRAFELPLYSLPDCVDEAYTLTWLPPFGAPVVVVVWRSGLQAFMSAKILHNVDSFAFGYATAINSRPLYDAEWRELTRLLDQASYWVLPSTVEEAIPEDGAVWFIDGVRSNQSQWVRRYVPNAEYAEVCREFIRLSGLETAHALYL